MIYIMHLSDLHIVNHSNWQNMKECLLRTLHEKMKNIPEGKKLLVITGDYHNHDEKDYEKAKEFINRLISETGLNVHEDVFVIPGNHDMSLSEDTKTRKFQNFTIQAVMNNITELQDDDTINMLLDHFSLYSQFCKELDIYTGDVPNPASVHVRTWRNKLNLLHINTALIADGKKKNDQFLDIKTLTSETITNLLANGHPTIALGHNNFYDLEKDTIQAETRAMFSRTQVSAYLCGDNHKFNDNMDTQTIKPGFGYKWDIPNIVSGKCATDENDNYSDFGFILHCWNEETDDVQWEKYRWNKKDQDSLLIEQHPRAIYSLSHKQEQTTRLSEPQYITDYSEVLELYKGYIHQQCTEIELAGLPTKTEDLRRSYALDRIFIPISFSVTQTADGFLTRGIDKPESLSTQSADIIVKAIDKKIEILEKQEELELLLQKTDKKLSETDKNIQKRKAEIAKLEKELERINRIRVTQKVDFINKKALNELIPEEGIFRYIILADPGAGKTTLLKLIASFYSFPDEFAEDDVKMTKRPLFPIWIRCRDIKDGNSTIKSIIYDIPQQGEWGLGKDYSSAFINLVNDQIKQGNALLLIDGLDEIGSDRDRRQFVSHLKSFIKNNSINVIVTSREKGFSIVTNNAFKDYTYLHINALSDDDIKNLCWKWYRLIYSDRNHEAEKKAEKISSEILNNPKVKRLAENPMLLTTLLLVERRIGNLPTKRAGLYYEAVRVLLETWNADQHERVDLEEAMYQLSYVAYAMSTNPNNNNLSFSQINQTELIKLITDVRREFPHLVTGNGQTPAEFIRIIEQRSAILVKKGEAITPDGHEENVYEFQHLTFQEYLAAYAITKCCYPNAKGVNRNGEALTQYLNKSEMKEIIQLTAAIDPFCAHQLTNTLIQKHASANDSKEKDIYRAILLNFIIDEVSISPDDIMAILNCCFHESIYSSDIQVMKSIVAGKNAQYLGKFLYLSDKQKHDGYSYRTPIYEILSGQINDPLAYYLSTEKTEPYNLVHSLSVLESAIWLSPNEQVISSYILKRLKDDLYLYATHSNCHVQFMALELIALVKAFSSKDDVSNYISAVIDYCNKENFNSNALTDFRYFLENEQNEYLYIDEKYTSLTTNALIEIKNQIETNILTSYDYYVFFTMFFILCLACNKSQVEEVEQILTKVEERRKYINVTSLKPTNAHMKQSITFLQSALMKYPHKDHTIYKAITNYLDKLISSVN